MKSCLFAVTLMLFLSQSELALADMALIPQSGQTTGYNSGDDGALRRGVGWPNPRFTDNRDGTATDNLTGLVWLKNAGCLTGTWLEALTRANSLASGVCGLADDSKAGDWRVPNVNELESLVDLSKYYPALPTGHPFIGVDDYPYWSSTQVEDGGWVWTVDMSTGGVGSDLISSYSYNSLLPVRDAR